MSFLFRKFKQFYFVITLILVGASQSAYSTSLAFIPYKHINQHLDSEHFQMQVVSPTGLRPLAILFADEGLKTQGVMWAFATGECGQETWGGVDAEAFARANIAQFERAKVDFYISTGGQAGIFTCSSDQAMMAMLQRYQSEHLKGIDFDIEGEQTPEQIQQLVARAKTIKTNFPNWRVSFTLATHAGSDRRAAHLNKTGRLVMQAIKAVGLREAIINLMVMDYGRANSAVCVVKVGRCDMGMSALQAAKNFTREYKWPASQVALTAMIGINDVQENVFKIADAIYMKRKAREFGIEALHIWSIDRDRSCEMNQALVQPNCHGLRDMNPWEFMRALRIE